MNILAVDSSSSVASVSLYKDGETFTKVNEDKLTHSQTLLPLIASLLEENNVTNNDLDLYLSSKGPGSFTGIRIGISTVKALAHVSKKNIISFTSLDMLAENVKEKAKYICAIINAKNNNAYYGVYKVENNKLVTVIENACENIDKIIENCKNLNEKILFVGDGTESYKENILVNNKFSIEEDLENNKQNSNSLLSLYFSLKDSVKEENYAAFKPAYYRQTQAERNLKK